MPRTIHVVDPAGPRRPAFGYHIAGRQLWLTETFASLTPLSLGPEAETATAPVAHPPPPDDQSQARDVYDGPVLVNGVMRQVRCAESPSALWLWVGRGETDMALGPIALSLDGAWLWLPPSWPDEAETIGQDLLLGPALTLALALDGVFCLHASSVALEGRAVAFIGELGSGKSTLAAYFEHGVAGPWTHVADDILPLEEVDGRLAVRPHFPQLKLEVPDHYPATAPDRLPLAEVYLLNPCDPFLFPRCQLQSPRASLPALLKATVSSPLFPRETLARQMAFMRRVAESKTAIYSLDYPHDARSLAPVAALVGITMKPSPGSGATAQSGP